MSLSDFRSVPSTRRHFFGRSAHGLGIAALASLLGEELPAAGLPGLPHFAPRAKRVVYLFQSGAPSQLDTFDYKPGLQKLRGQDLPDSVRQGQRLTAMTATQASFPIAPSIFPFRQHGESGAWLSDLLPHTAQLADRLCIVKSMHTEAINHDPAITYINTGTQQFGRPSMGSWLSYGLGSLSDDLPAYVIMISVGVPSPARRSTHRLWGSGYLPSKHQGVQVPQWERPRSLPLRPARGRPRPAA